MNLNTDFDFFAEYCHGCYKFCLPVKVLHLQWIMLKSRSSHAEVFLGKGVLKICSKLTGGHLCRSVISIKLQLYWNRTSAWVFCKFASYFQNTFSQEHLWVAASENRLRPNLKMHQNKYDFRNLKMVAASNQTTVLRKKCKLG